MSRTGNLLFPEDEDGGWVTTIIKALPQDEPPAPELTPAQMHIDDPVAIEADSAFSGLAAETATRDAIYAAGWSADVVGPEKAPPPTPDEIRALDAAIAHEAGNAFFGAVDDPVAASADATFAETAADVAARHAIEAAGWSAGSVRGVDVTPPAPADAPLSPEALEALDSVIARQAGDPDFGLIDDPLAARAEARFAESAADAATREAIAGAGWSAKPVEPHIPIADLPPPTDDVRDLDALIAQQSGHPGFAAVDDPVALQADARFAEHAADQAMRQAVADAGWSAETMAPPVRAAAAPPPAEDTGDLDALIAQQSGRHDFAAVDDPVALQADARFAERAAEQATEDALADAGWWARPATEGGQPTPAELRQLDAIADKASAADGRFAVLDDPVALAADSTFAETAAEVATSDALRAARIAAVEEAMRGVEAPVPVPGAPLTPAELQTLDEIASRIGDIEARFAAEDPVAIEAEAAFAERAADLAIADAIFAAQWHPRAMSADTRVAEIARRGGLESLEIEDLVRAEAEIAFEDAAYDQAYAAVDSLVTGEAAALAAFDQAIAAGADPEEALQLAIAAAEEMDPRSFGGLARVATLPLEDFGLVQGRPPAEAAAATAEAPAEPSPRPLDPTAPPAFTVAAVGQGFIAVTGAALLFGAAGTDTLAEPSFRFVLDPGVISAPGSGFRAIERDDLIFVPPAVAARNSIRGSAGDDFLVGSDGNDAIAGLEGDDYIYGDRPTNYDPGVHDIGNPLTDPLFGSGGDDVISGGAGADFIWGGPGNDIIDGDVTDGTGLTGEFPFSLGDATPGADVIHGGAGNDTIYGGGGADTLHGDSGNDNIFGYAGDDVIVGGQGIDVVTGGAGADEFRFAGGSGATPLAHAQSLGTDVVKDFSEAEGDTFGLSDADFGLGAAGTLTDGTNYFEHAPATLTAAPIDASSGATGPAIVVFGDAAGADGVSVYYTDDASAMTDANSYQIADVENVNLTQIDGADFTLRA